MQQNLLEKDVLEEAHRHSEVHVVNVEAPGAMHFSDLVEIFPILELPWI